MKYLKLWIERKKQALRDSFMQRNFTLKRSVLKLLKIQVKKSQIQFELASRKLKGKILSKIWLELLKNLIEQQSYRFEEEEDNESNDSERTK